MHSKAKVYGAGLFALTGLIVSACQEPTSPPRSDPEARRVLQSLTAPDRDLIQRGNGFGFRLFAQSLDRSERDANILISPFSVSVCLTMACQGARGATLAAMEQALGYGGLSLEAVDSAYRKVIPALLRLDGRAQFTMANSIWSQAGFAVAPDFLARNRDVFDAETRALDFRAPGAPDTLNAWVKAKTRGLIPEIVDASMPLPPDLVLMLLDALYFKGSWSQAFERAASHDGTFHVDGARTVPCRFMHREGEYRHVRVGGAQGVELAYGDSLFSMVAMLPDSGRDVDSLAHGLGGLWDQGIGGLEPGQLSLDFPRFRMGFGVSLKPALSALGMDPAFGDGADFTGIAAAGLAISDVFHKTEMRVDEDGTEAAAVTRVDVRATSVPVLPRLVFDRPFLLAIRERESGAILFLGKVAAPEALP